MQGAPEQADFSSVKARLAQIAESVSDETMPLDDALDLFEEAVAIGLKVGDLLEEGIASDADRNGVADDEDGQAVRIRA